MSTYQTKVNDLLKQRASLYEQMKAIVDGADTDKRSLTAEEVGSYDALDTQLNELDQQRKRYEDMDQREVRRHAQTLMTTKREPGRPQRHAERRPRADFAPPQC